MSKATSPRKPQQLALLPSEGLHRYSHGGELRQKRAGRKQRPLSGKDPLHLVFKANRELLPGGFRSPRSFPICIEVIRHFADYFFVRVEQMSICGDHIHLLVRASQRSSYHHFFRVVAGQIAQRLQIEGLARISIATPKQASQTKPVSYRSHRKTVTDTLAMAEAGAGAVATPAPQAQKPKSRHKVKHPQRRTLRLWKWRPFTRVLKGWRSYKVVRDYIRLNELEASGRRAYSQTRTQGFDGEMRRRLWNSS